jgi:uncharacterized integral membrane protein
METEAPQEPTRLERMRRRWRHVRLYTSTALLVLAVAYGIGLIASNTRHVKVSWVFGSGHASLVWITLGTAVAGWLAGIATSMLLRRRHRRL